MQNAAEPAAEPPSFPTLEVLGPELAVIVKGAARFELRGAMATKISRWHAHQLIHGEVFAQTYLTGVLHGIQTDLFSSGRLREEARRAEEG